MRPVTYLFIFYQASDAIYILSFINAFFMLIGLPFSLLSVAAVFFIYVLEVYVSRMLREAGIDETNMGPLL